MSIKLFNFAVILCLLPLYGNNSSGSAIERALKSSLPHLFLVTKSPKDTLVQTLPLRLSEEWVDRDLQILLVEKGSSEEALIHTLLQRIDRVTIGNGEFYWVLTGEMGKPLLATQAQVTWKELHPVLLSNMGPSPIAKSTAFLEKNPNHWPVRYKLIQRLAGLLSSRLFILNNNNITTISPELDEILWGNLARELDAALCQPDWLSGESGLFIHQLLPPLVPEQQSTLMKGLYSKHRPKVIDLLENYPGHPGLTSALIRMNFALRDFKWPLLDHSRPETSFSNRFRFLASVHANSILKSGLISGQLREASDVLSAIWFIDVFPSIEDGSFFHQYRSINPNVPKLRSFEMAQEALWIMILDPLLESLIRLDEIVKVKNLLSSLSESKTWIVTKDRIQALLVRLKRTDLNLSSVLSRPPLEPLPPHLPWLVPGALVVQSQPYLEKTQSLAVKLAIRGYRIRPMPMELPQEAAHALGWEVGKPRWALMGKHQHPVLEGELLPSATDFHKLLQSIGVRSDADILQAYIQSHPRYLPALIELTSIYVEMIEGIQNELTLREDPNISNLDLEFARGRLLFCVTELLNHPLGTMTDTIVYSRLQRVFQSSGNSLDAWRLMLRPSLPKLDADLGRRPNDEWLWRLWMVAHSGSDKTPLKRLEGLASLPDEKKSTYPNAKVLQAISNHLEQQQDWQGVCTLLAVRWNLVTYEANLFKSRAEILSQGAWSDYLSRTFLTALLREKRRIEIDRFLSELDVLGMKPSNWGAVIPLANSLGETTIAEKLSSP